MVYALLATIPFLTVMKPKFEMVLKTLDEELSGTGTGTWNSVKGGYFVALDTMEAVQREPWSFAKTQE